MNLINRFPRLLTFAFGFCLLASASTALQAQILDPVAWSFSVHETEQSNQVNLVFHADVEPCWHIYSQFLEDPNGPLPTFFELELPDGVEAIGAVEECQPIVEYDPNFMMDLKFFEEEVNWVQTIQINGDVTESVNGRGRSRNDRFGAAIFRGICDLKRVGGKEEGVGVEKSQSVS